MMFAMPAAKRTLLIPVLAALAVLLLALSGCSGSKKGSSQPDGSQTPSAQGTTVDPSTGGSLSTSADDYKPNVATGTSQTCTVDYTKVAFGTPDQTAQLDAARKPCNEFGMANLAVVGPELVVEGGSYGPKPEKQREVFGPMLSELTGYSGAGCAQVRTVADMTPGKDCVGFAAVIYRQGGLDSAQPKWRADFAEGKAQPGATVKTVKGIEVVTAGNQARAFGMDRAIAAFGDNAAATVESMINSGAK